MGIRGLDNWLTSPPEETDWIEEAEKLQTSWEAKDDREEYLISIIEGLLGII